MNNDLPPIAPEHANFAQWLTTPEQCYRLYPSVCNGKAIMRLKLAGSWHAHCKPCLKAMKEQMARILDWTEEQ